jgi:hypothetical protein
VLQKSCTILHMRLLILLLLVLLSVTGSADEFNLTDSKGNDISIQVHAAKGDLLMIWLLDHNEPRPMFDTLLENIVKAGIEVWKVDLLEAYFIPRSSENIRTLSGDGVAAILNSAHLKSDKRILLAAYDRMPLPLLRGVHLWQAQATNSRLSGALLFYPNLFGPPPIAGEAPIIDPILYATNTPLVIYQPALGNHRWRMREILSVLWQAGSPSYLYLIPRVRDWFFMGEGDAEATKDEINVTEQIPRQIKQLASLLESHPKPSTPLPITTQDSHPRVIRSLVELKQPKPAPSFDLSDIDGQKLSSTALEPKKIS